MIVKQYSHQNFFAASSGVYSFMKVSSFPVPCPRLSFAEVQSLPELKVNPFRERICKVFSTNGQGINFEDFLDMSSVFSECMCLYHLDHLVLIFVTHKINYMH